MFDCKPVIKKVKEELAEAKEPERAEVLGHYLTLLTQYEATRKLILDETGKTHLMCAAGLGHADVAKALLSAGMEVNAKDPEEGVTALMCAAGHGHADVVKILLSAGADVNAMDGDKKTALMHAARRGHVNTTKELLSARADVNAKDSEGKTALSLAGTSEIKDMLRKAGAKE